MSRSPCTAQHEAATKVLEKMPTTTEERRPHADVTHADAGRVDGGGSTRPNGAVAPGAGEWAALASLRKAFAQLSATLDCSALARNGLRALCVDCGFERAVMFVVEDAQMRVAEAYFLRDPEWARETIRFSQVNPTPLGRDLEETEALRRRRAILISDAQDNPNTLSALVQFTQATNYVAAPLIVNSRVVAFIHADLFYSGQRVTPFHRDLIWAFAEGFAGYLKAAAREELSDRQRAAVRSALGEYDEASLHLPIGGEVVPALSSAALTPMAVGIPFGELTVREREILSLVAAGGTNTKIAHQLVIAVSTVKSHVKSIMRKLGVHSRAELVYTSTTSRSRVSTSVRSPPGGLPMRRAHRTPDRATSAEQAHDGRRKSPPGGEGGLADARYVDRRKERDLTSRRVRGSACRPLGRNTPGTEKVKHGYHG